MRRIALFWVLIFCISATASQRKTVAAAPTSSQKMSPQELFKRVSASVFVVEVLDLNDAVVARGSGVAVARERVVTNRHVLDAGSVYKLRQGDNSWRAFVSWVDPDHDLAVVKADGLNASPAALRLSPAVAVGERVYAIGTPEGLELTLSEGIISGLRDYQDGRIIQTSAAISPGSSGGGLFDEEARMIGVTTFAIVEGQNLNFALPSEWVQAITAQPMVRPSQTPPRQQMIADKFKTALEQAMVADHNLDVLVQERRQGHDVTYKPPEGGEAAVSLQGDAALKCISDEQSPECSENWMPWVMASLEMFILRESIHAAEPTRDALEADVVNPARTTWADLADAYCEDRPAGLYTDLEDRIRACPKPPRGGN